MTIYDNSKKVSELYDTHTHLNDETLGFDVESYIARADEFGVKNMNIVGFDTPTNKQALVLADKYKKDGLHAIIGWSPDESDKFDDENFEMIDKQLSTNNNVVGVGETGLDLYHKEVDIKIQEESFEKHIFLANKHNVPLTIHSRETHKEVVNMLKKTNFEKFVIHSFSGNSKEVEEFLSLGGNISYSGMVTFSKNKDLSDSLEVVPLDRMIIETDAPFLTPVPKRGQTNEPAFVKYTAEFIAKYLKKDYKEIADITTKNAKRIWLLNK